MGICFIKRLARDDKHQECARSTLSRGNCIWITKHLCNGSKSLLNNSYLVSDKTVHSHRTWWVTKFDSFFFLCVWWFVTVTCQMFSTDTTQLNVMLQTGSGSSDSSRLWHRAANTERTRRTKSCTGRLYLAVNLKASIRFHSWLRMNIKTWES